MASSTKVQAMKLLMDTMTAVERREIYIYSRRLRKQNQGLGFMDLPAEIRNRIYRFSITPAVIDRHVKKGHAPALVTVSKQVWDEFKGLYYSSEFINAKLYDPKTSAWSEVTDQKKLRALLAHWSFSKVFPDLMHDSMAEAEEWAETKLIEIRVRKARKPVDLGRRYGTLRWKGEQDGRTYGCVYARQSEKREYMPGGKLTKRKLLPNGEYEEDSDSDY